jgi:hypothetical protein
MSRAASAAARRGRRSARPASAAGPASPAPPAACARRARVWRTANRDRAGLSAPNEETGARPPYGCAMNPSSGGEAQRQGSRLA